MNSKLKVYKKAAVVADSESIFSMFVGDSEKLRQKYKSAIPRTRTFKIQSRRVAHLIGTFGDD
jgi:hypothetical protein